MVSATGEGLKKHHHYDLCNEMDINDMQHTPMKILTKWIVGFVPKLSLSKMRIRK